ncbi:MAG TPA: hypothetical protein VGX25_15790 [Actinophytocola sp.]|nr:hypothetical protein [Actinophytocola sp.]HEV2780847.1 hypothetical protein [Actinophytocola sp.]
MIIVPVAKADTTFLAVPPGIAADTTIDPPETTISTSSSKPVLVQKIS